MDILLQKFFEKERWETAIEKGVGKGISKTELRRLCSPQIRLSLYKAIANDQYRIAPPHTALIPKDNGDYRTVYINENMDRIVLSIANDLLFELCPDMIHPSCTSYQKGIGTGKVVQQISREIVASNSKDCGWKADFTKYFDSVPLIWIDEIFDRVEQRFGKSALISVLREFYHCDYYFDTDGNLQEKYQSLKQGCAVASFLADAILYDLDEALSSLKGTYVRYSDDTIYIGRDNEEAMQKMKEILDRKGLTLNPRKIERISPYTYVKFLGFNIKGNKISLSKGRVKNFQHQVRIRSVERKPVGQKAMEKSMADIYAWLYQGDEFGHSWATGVLPIINVEEDIDTLNGYIMDCLRAVYTGKKKLGGLGSVQDREYTIVRGKGRNVKENKKKLKNIPGYYTIRCMRNALMTSRGCYDTLVRNLA